MLTRIALRATVSAAFLLIFNTFFFVLGGRQHGTPVWVSYAFVHFSYVALLAAPYLVPKSRSSALFGLTTGAVAAAYFVIEFIVGGVFILVSPERYEAPFLTQLLLAGLFVVFFAWTAVVNESTRAGEQDSRIETDYLKRAISEVESIVPNIHDRETRRKVESVFDAIASSPVKSHHSLSVLEARILSAIGTMGEMAGSSNWQGVMSQSDALLGMLSEPQRQLKLLN
jgi:hypothetical protein